MCSLLILFRGNETVGNLFVSLLSLEAILDYDGENPIIPTATVAGSLNNGVYRYNFQDIPAGEYFVRASTNNDGDDFFFDEGEAKGIYPSFSNVTTVVADQESLTDVDFDVQFFGSNLEAPNPSSIQSTVLHSKRINKER